MDDREVVAHQLGRVPRAFGRVAARCPWGLPAVTEQTPYGSTGEPFPTTFYVTCPHLVRGISRLEAAGGVERWSARVADDPTLRASLAAASREQAEVRIALAGGERGRDDGASLAAGIAGSRSPLPLKCLHAHAAFALARPGYLVGEMILDELPGRWPDDGCCCAAGG